jgi:hypothetical protein
VFFLAAKAEGPRNKRVLNSWGNAVRYRQEKSSSAALCPEQLRPREQEIRLFSTAGGTLLEMTGEKNS